MPQGWVVECVSEPAVVGFVGVVDRQHDLLGETEVVLGSFVPNRGSARNRELPPRC